MLYVTLHLKTGRKKKLVRAFGTWKWGAAVTNKKYTEVVLDFGDKQRLEDFWEAWQEKPRRLKQIPGRNVNTEGTAGEIPGGSEEQASGNWKKGNPFPTRAEA